MFNNISNLHLFNQDVFIFTFCLCNTCTCIYSLVILAVFEITSPVAMLHTSMWLLCYLHEPRGLQPSVM